MGVASLPAGWRVELLGLINAVEFSHPNRGMRLLWADGAWTISTAVGTIAAPGIPDATSQAEARTVGTRWLTETEAAMTTGGEEAHDD